MIPLALAGLAAAAEIWVGAGGQRDLTDRLGDEADSASFAVGPVVFGDVRLEMAPVVDLRSGLSLTTAAGQDRVTWLAGETRLVSDEHYTRLTAGRLHVGPELSVDVGGRLRPYFGSLLGLAWVQTWHSFDSRMLALYDPEKNDLDSEGNIDPFASQVAPVVEVLAGVGIGEPPLAIRVEVGYSVSFLREVELRKSASDAGSLRTAYVFNPLRIGISISLPPTGGADR